MINPIQHILTASRETLQKKHYLLLFVILGCLMFVGMFALPLFAIPGNTIDLQTELFATKDFLLLALLSLLSSIVLTMQIRIWKEVRATIERHVSTATTLAGIVSGIISSLFASATCALCVGALFSFLGFGTLVFLVNNRWYILLGGFILLFTSLYLSSRRINEGCSSCEVASV